MKVHFDPQILHGQERGRAAARVEAAEAHARAAQLEAQGLEGALRAAEERAREEGGRRLAAVAALEHEKVHLRRRLGPPGPD